MHQVRAVLKLAACALTLAAIPVQALAQGWTNLTPPAGAQVFYVSAAGSDTNPGTQAAPFRTLARGLQAARDGFPDQVLLRCGDTFTETEIDITKGSGSFNSYLVIGSYGTGPRPRFIANNDLFRAGSRIKTGVAIVGLHLEYAGTEQNTTSMFFGDGWSHILVEDCYISKWANGIVMHETGTGRLNDVKIRRNIIVDCDDTDTRGGAIFMGATDGIVMEENLFDYSGRVTGIPTTNGFHNVYIHETNGAAVFNGNISTRASSHGLQQRPGGQTINNLFAENAINCYQGGNAGVNNVLMYNVVIGARDISAQDPRGVGYEVAGRGQVFRNIAAHQVLGTDAVVAFGFSGFDWGTVSENYVYDWKAPGGQGWATAVQWDGGTGSVVFEKNRLFMPNNGMLVRHESRPVSSQFTYRNNTYFTSTPTSGVGGYLHFATATGWGQTWDQWRARETASVFTVSAPSNPNLTFQSYMQSLGLSGGLPEFLAEVRKQSRQFWRPQFTAAAFNDWARARAGLPLFGGGGPASCYANCDGSASPVLSIADYQCFLTRFSQQDPYANCDQSIGNPMFTVNDFVCFLNRYAAGCN